MPQKIDEEHIIRSLSDWVDRNGWAGWDPYDVKAHPGVIRMAARSARSKPVVYLRELLYELFYRFPLSSRKLLRIRPRVIPKAMGLFSTSFLSLHKTYSDPVWMDKSLECLNWLKENPDPTDVGLGWGYPFDWQSTGFIPSGTPNGIVTTAVGETFWKHYQHSGSKETLELVRKTAEFLQSLPVDELSEDKICFSYTPLFKNHVHNLNLFVAEYLIKAGMELKQEEWIQSGMRALNYTLADQLEDGSFDYNGPPEKPQNFIDNYHSGFVIRMLYSIWKLTGREDVKLALDKCLSHYMDNFFENERIPWLLPNRKYRIDIHSCAEAITCLSEVSPDYPEALDRAGKVLEWTVENLRDPKGFFYYGFLKSRFTGRVYRSKIPYIRWGQAWMLKALSSYAEQDKKTEVA
jgi:hypothetical protein